MYAKSVSNIEVFQGLDNRQIEELYSWLERRDFGAGADILREGEVPNGLFLLCEGKVSVVKGSMRGKFKLDEISSPSFFGEVALLDSAVRSATVKAVTPVVTGLLSTEIFDGKIRANNLTALLIALNLGRILARRFRTVTTTLANKTAAISKVRPVR